MINSLPNAVTTGAEALAKGGSELARLTLPSGPTLNAAASSAARTAISATETGINGIVKMAAPLLPLAGVGALMYSGLKMIVTGTPPWPFKG